MWRNSPRRRDIENLLTHADALGLSRGARNRLHWFAFALAHNGNVSLTCRYFGISRSTFDRWASRFDARNPETLEEHSRKPHHVRAPQTPQEVIALIRQYRMETPHAGKETIAEILKTRHGIRVSASTVGRVIAREKLFFADSASHVSKRTHQLDLIPDRPPRAVSEHPRAADQTSGALPLPDFPVFGS